MYQDTLLFENEVRILRGVNFFQVLPDYEFLSCQRKAMGLSQSDVATAAGIQLRQYQRFESGERSMASASLRIGLAICDVLKLDPHRFVPMLPQKNDSEVQIDSDSENAVSDSMERFKRPRRENETPYTLIADDTEQFIAQIKRPYLEGEDFKNATLEDMELMLAQMLRQYDALTEQGDGDSVEATEFLTKIEELESAIADMEDTPADEL